MDASIPQNAVTYKHDPLPDAAAYMRLLQVLDDNYSEDIKVSCEMTTWPLDDMPSYHAISYTWGDPASNTTILINGKASRVRTNCEFVLKQAYGFEKNLYYWVDAICINQENLEEKGTQVSIMGSIYKKAAHVLSCVGDHADDSAFLFQKLRQQAFTKHPNRFYKDMSLSLRFRLRQRTSTPMRFLDAAVCFLDRPYFTRLWVLQELRNAQEATFLCGSDAISKPVIHGMAGGIWDYSAGGPRGIPSWVPKNIASKVPVFRRLCAGWEYRQNSSSAFHQKHENLYELGNRAWLIIGVLVDVWTLIEAASMLQCQEAKDKLFGLISLIDWGPSSTIIPDYTQTEFEAAVSFFKALLSSTTYQRGSMGIMDITMICMNVVDTLGLNIDSHGVPSALESRRTGSGTILADEETAVEFAHSRYEISPGWRMSSEHLGKSDLGLTTWSPPGSDEPQLYLPFWAKGGDWVVCSGNYSYSSRYVVVREAAEGFGASLIGRAVYGKRGIDFKNEASANFRIHWDPEDLVIYSVVENEIMEQGNLEYSSQCAPLLNTAVCKKQTPSSSYALRCDAISCQL